MRSGSTKSRNDDVAAELPSLRRYAQALTRDEGAADDLVQDALLRAFERRSTFRLGGNIRSWLLSVLHNVFVDGRRRAAAQRRGEAEAARLADVALPAGQESAVRLAQVKQAFFSLPEEQRAALHLVAVEGLAYSEAAEALGIPVGTLMSRLGRARAALRAFEAETSPDRSGAPAFSKPSFRPKLRVIGGRDG
ncbi:sigma-70 family RNA polymerase sigma factor [Enterovirga sp. CN4-39]|uniref:sigma-70 family RNA polymerase sigma factor n=1 Tax=Enterovirga sp. CN4-39 TaxID=3400910 RepID=UPI003C08C8FF